MKRPPVVASLIIYYTVSLFSKYYNLAQRTIGVEPIIYCNTAAQPAPPVAQANFDCSGVTAIPVSECNALVAIYEGMNGTEWQDRALWFNRPNPCEWALLGCTNGHITYFELQAGAKGAVVAEISQLTQLQTLYLSNGQLSGTLPASMAQLTQLTHLFIYGSASPSVGLTGEVPAMLGNLTNLRFLYLNGQQFTVGIPDSFGNLVHLEELVVDSNQRMTGALPQSLTNLSKLRVLQTYSTKLCAPNNAAFSQWLQTVGSVSGDLVVCS